MRRVVLFLSLCLVGCQNVAPTPPVSQGLQPVDPNFKTLALPPDTGGVNFLLASSGSKLLDPDGRAVLEMDFTQEDQKYSTRLGLLWTKRFNPNNQQQTYRLIISLEGQTDPIHRFSDNIPTAFIEVDGTNFPAVPRSDLDLGAVIFIENLTKEVPSRIEIELSKEAIKEILAAKAKVSVKVQLKSDRLAQTNICFSDGDTVDDYSDCRFAYSGRNVQGEALSQLKALLQS